MVNECDLKVRFAGWHALAHLGCPAPLGGKLSLINDVQSLWRNCLEVLVRMMSAEVERPRS